MSVRRDSAAAPSRRRRSDAASETPARRRARVRASWIDVPAGRVIKAGHPIADFLGAPQWRLLERRDGFVRVEAELVDRLRNLRNQLFGGYTPTYVDFLSLYVIRSRGTDGWDWSYDLATTQMRVDYFEPVIGPRFFLEGRIVRERGASYFVETRFLDERDNLLVLASSMFRKLAKRAAPPPRRSGRRLAAR